MSRFETLDNNIISILSNQPTPVFDIWLKFRDEVKNINVIDRRMQYLKKKLLVANIRGKGWVKL
ncbi:hypothetical protein [Enterobacter asburiae]|uniref:hypothetical protein n=1 Tax=Enterobacter asburiae TaxID=61645 RepID=UPI00200550FD|nr:hypothetical protein [Enterobacter asburiae]MCK6993082.1 hypothetical protein [Enterobacter asburiae]